MKKPVIIIFLILLFDQSLKFWVKTHMYLGANYSIFGEWSYIHFTENNGMAFGMQFAGSWGKLVLSLFRIFAIIALGYWLFLLTRRNSSFGLIFTVSLIFAGAMGNIIDSAFYGMFFSESTYTQVAAFLPPEGGYSTFLHGRVVDMLYFPLIHGNFPLWVPFWGGQEFVFFRPVFNIADSSISVGVFSLILFQKRFFRK